VTGMTKRERVLRAIQCEETDQIPVYDIFQNDAIIEHYSRQSLSYDNSDWVKGLAIGKVLDMTSSPEGPRFPGIERRQDGLVIQQERWSRWVAHRPYDTEAEMERWIQIEISNVRSREYGQSYRQRTHDDIRRYQKYFAEGDATGRGDPTVLAVESTVGLSELYWYTGSKNFLTLLREQPWLVDEWIEARARAELIRIHAIADADLFPVVMVSDDIVTKSGIAFGPDWLQAHWMPKLKQVVDAWHSHKTYVIFRSEGHLMPYLADLVATGIDGLCPLEGMPIQTIRDRYPKLALLGGIDAGQLLAFATPMEVRKVCRDAIIAAARRGYFLGSSSTINWECQVENVVAMYESSGSKADRPAPPKRRF
jgi:hypothetical protein